MLLSFIEENSAVIILVLSIITVLLAVLTLVVLKREKNLRRRYNFFMGANSRPDINLETTVREYIDQAREIDRKYSGLLSCMEDMKSNMDKCLQKIGVVRYNPFSEMGGKLCFAIAVLDGENNGFVLNGIHSRTGSYTYAKPISNGQSEYTLSAEELEALRIALDSTYESRYNFTKLLAEKPSRVYRIKAADRDIKKEKAHLEELYKRLAAKSMPRSGKTNPENEEDSFSGSAKDQGETHEL